ASGPQLFIRGSTDARQRDALWTQEIAKTAPDGGARFRRDLLRNDRMHQYGESIRIMLQSARPNQSVDFSEDRISPRQMSSRRGINRGKMVVHVKQEEQEAAELTEKEIQITLRILCFLCCLLFCSFRHFAGGEFLEFGSRPIAPQSRRKSS